MIPAGILKAFVPTQISYSEEVFKVIAVSGIYIVLVSQVLPYFEAGRLRW